MANGKRTRFALVRSLLCAALCLALLVGTTFAWFSDEAKTGDTTITAGNLDVELLGATEKEDGGYQPGEPIGERDSVFTGLEGFLWEPGAMFASDPFLVNNAGTLALYYKLNVKMTNAATDPETPDITEVIKWKLVFAEKAGDLPADGVSAEERQAFWESIGGDETTAHGGEGMLMAGNHGRAWRVVLYWEPGPSTAISPEENPDNKYNLSADKYGADGANAPKADFSLDVFATQASFESDSFGAGYDAPAKDMVPVEVSTEQGLEEALENGGKNIHLSGDINLNDSTDATHVSFLIDPGVTVDGEGYTLTSHSVKKTPGILNFEISEGGNTEPAAVKNLNINYDGTELAIAVSVVTGREVVLENVKAEGKFFKGLTMEAGAHVTANNCVFEGKTAVEANITADTKLVLNNTTLRSSFEADKSVGVINVKEIIDAADIITLNGCTLEATVDTETSGGTAYCVLVSNLKTEETAGKNNLGKMFGVGDSAGFSQILENNTVTVNGSPATVDNLFGFAYDWQEV